MNRTHNMIGVGIVGGIFSGLTGVGGSAILVSLMVAWLGMSQHRAQGTTPAVILPTALVGAASYAVQGLNGQFRFDAGLALSLIPAIALPSIAGVAIGATWMSVLPAAQLRRAFGVFLFFVALSMLTRGILPIGTASGQSLAIPFIFWILLGFVAGVLSGFLGIGGAMVIIPFMTLGAGIPQHMTQGVSLAIIAITAIAGAYTQYRLGHVEGSAVVPMGISSVVAVVAASLVAGQIDSFWLTKIFGLALLFFSYQFTFGSTIPKPPVASSRAPVDFSPGSYQI
ncbi:MAG: sulfite exporter TauE/SafE family protein [Chloroflexi bacterium]|nr:sulfite exporter TauE/SafE family protein [Chloroflexota bacterium]